MRLTNSRNSGALQWGLLSALLVALPCLAESSHCINSQLLAQSGPDSSVQGAQSGNTNLAKPDAPSAETTSSVTSSASESPTNMSIQSSTSDKSTSDTVPGPLFEKRKLLLGRIQAAKKQGTGISGYMAEYGRIEQMVKAGEPESNYADRLDSLQNNIDEQIKRSQILKTQHPVYTAPPISSGSASASSVSHSGGGSIGGMSIDQLKAKYGDKVPSGIAEKLGSMTPDQQRKLLDSDMVKKFLDK